jgi:hypothetical protein
MIFRHATPMITRLRVSSFCVNLVLAILIVLSAVASSQAQMIPLGNLELTLSRPVFNATNTTGGLRIPTVFDTPNDGSGKFYIGGQQGRISQFQGGVETLFMNIPSVFASGGTGLLGLAFHPEHTDPLSPGYRKFYTYHSTPVDAGATITFSEPAISTVSHHNVLTEWQVSASNLNVADMSSKREIYREAHPLSLEHNGGALDFGPDGYLYVTTGVPPGAYLRSQSLESILGKVLRIDPLSPSLTSGSLDPVSGNGEYRIPTSNPFVSQPSALGEIYAYGLRNPYKMSVDPVSGIPFLGDVGQGAREEVDAILPGANYGWPYREGSIPYTGTPPVDAVFTDPIAEYTHADGRSITGGFVYRGSIPELQGKYIFAEFSFGTGPFGSNPGRLFWIDPFNEQGELRSAAEISIKEFRFSESTLAIFDSFSPDVGDNIDITIYSMGADDDGEIYILGEEANRVTVYKIESALNLSPPGDFDGDLDVDGDDLIKWQADYGVNGNSDADGDGDSDGRDFLIWQRNFGTGVAPLNSVTAVPEPGTCLLGLALFGALVGCRRRRTS